MADSVTATHGGITVTTNTASEADLRAEMERPEPQEAPSQEAPAAETPGTPPAPVRDPKGRFAPKTDVPAEAAPPPDVPGTPADAPAEPPARRRDDAPRHNPIARMNQALAQKAEAERRAAMLEAELSRYRQPQLPVGPPSTPSGVTSPVTPATSAEPQFQQFANEPDPYTAYMQAWARWDRAQALAQARSEWETAQTEKAKAQTFQTHLATGRTAYPDFDQVLTTADTLGLQVSAVMQEAIADSPKAADLVYYLATHPEECTQLAAESQMTPVAAATVMRRLLESHLAPRAAASPGNGAGAGTAARAAVSTAKPPVTPVGSSPVVSDEPPGESATPSEHARYWNRKLKVPGTR